MNKKLVIPVLLAAFLWFLMFSIWTKHLFNFWIGIAISATILMVVAIILRKEILKQFQWTWKAIGFGLLAAVALWVIFYVGEYLSGLLLGFAREQVAFVGDRLYTDVATGANNGAKGLLVMTGETKAEDIPASPVQPDGIYASLGEMGALLRTL